MPFFQKICPKTMHPWSPYLEQALSSHFEVFCMQFQKIKSKKRKNVEYGTAESGMAQLFKQDLPMSIPFFLCKDKNVGVVTIRYFFLSDVISTINFLISTINLMTYDQTHSYIVCRGVLVHPSNLAPPTTTNCSGPLSTESPILQISIFCQPPACVKPFQERHAIAHACTQTRAKAFRNVINCTCKSNFLHFYYLIACA